MLKSLLGSLSRERILTFIAAREEGYAREMTEFWKCPDRPIKRELNRLEGAGVLTAKSYGRTILYRLNLRFYLRKELSALLRKAIEAYPPEWRQKLLFSRRRPRAKGKPVIFLEEMEKKPIP